MDSAPHTPPSTPPEAAPKRWPRRVAIGLVATGVIVGGALWYLGRETTLQMIAERVARETGGKLSLTGVSGSLYGIMHVDRIVWRTDEQVAVATNVDLDWSPRQLISRGIAVDKLHIKDVRFEVLKESKEPRSPMPDSLASPFPISVADARVAKLTYVSAGSATQVKDIRLGVSGNSLRWELRDAAASTPWGALAASGNISAIKPFKLDAKASLRQQGKEVGPTPANLNLHAGGDLETTILDATGKAGAASGEARITLAPFAEIPLRTLALKARNLDPGFFGPDLPTADLNLALAAQLSAQRVISGSVNLVNDGAVGTLDQQRLPLRALRGQLGGTLDKLTIADVLLDFGQAGRFTGAGSVARGKDDTGLGTAKFSLHTDQFDLQQIHASIRPTRIAGDIDLRNVGQTQHVEVHLNDSALRLNARAQLENNLLTVEDATLLAGSGSIALRGSANLADDKAFKVTASSSRFNPAALGDYPQADINLAINAAGVMAPDWRVTTDFALRPSRFMNQPLSGQGKLAADARHLSGIDATLALGQNTVKLNGNFGAAGERLAWHLDGRELSAVRSNLYGALTAHGVVTGTMQAPRSSFNIDADGLGWIGAERKNNAGKLHASGDAWLAGNADARYVAASMAGNMQRLNPAAFGSPLAGQINGAFTANGRSGADWNGKLDLKLAESTLAKSPLGGHASMAIDRRHISGADVDLRVGPNLLTANGNFGSGSDVLRWKLSAPQLAALGPDFGGDLNGEGTLAGSMDAPSLTAKLVGNKLKFLGAHTLGKLDASVDLGAGRGSADPLAVHLAIADYSSGDTQIAAATLNSEGTRGQHTLRATLLNEEFDAHTQVSGGWRGDSWNGTLAVLEAQRRLQSAARRAQTAAERPKILKLMAPAPLAITVAPGAGIAGLGAPVALSLTNAKLQLRNGEVLIDNVNKDGPLWRSKGRANAVTLQDLSQFSPGLRDMVRGDLKLGADWDMRMQSAASSARPPALAGNLHLFRQSGDASVGSSAPMQLGLRTFDLNAEVQGSALVTTLKLDGEKTGKADMNGRVQLLNGHVDADSPLRISAQANMPSIAWLAPLAGQPDLELGGKLQLDLTGAGTIASPTLQGNISSDGLAIRWPEQGVDLRNGVLRAKLERDSLVLQQLDLQGSEGSASASGQIRFGDKPTIDLSLEAKKLSVLSRPDRSLIISGAAKLVRDASNFSLKGDFKADRALIEFAPAGRPTISDDVVVLGRSEPGKVQKKASDLPLTIDLTADLGKDFRLRGLGLDATLAGEARVKMVSGNEPVVNGTIRVTSGNYAAYGQKLAIERGVLTFSGAYDNPSLDILAVRKRPEGEQLSETNVEAGVQVRGNAHGPTARLVSTPSVPDSEKLSWLVLGHGMEGTSGGDRDVLSAAAGALLGGSGGGFQSKLANSLGVDELGLGQGSGGGNAEGLANTVVTVGKRISDRAYISFEQGAGTATSLVRLRYTINPRLTLQFQTGTNNALDLLYSWAFD